MHFHGGQSGWQGAIGCQLRVYSFPCGPFECFTINNTFIAIFTKARKSIAARHHISVAEELRTASPGSFFFMELVLHHNMRACGYSLLQCTASWGHENTVYHNAPHWEDMWIQSITWLTLLWAVVFSWSFFFFCPNTKFDFFLQLFPPPPPSFQISLPFTVYQNKKFVLLVFIFFKVRYILRFQNKYCRKKGKRL